MQNRPKKMNKETRLERDRRIWALRQQGLKQEEIAEQFGISQVAICKILMKATNAFRAEYAEDVKEVKLRLIQRLEYTAGELFQAWERSKDSAKTTTIKKPVDGSGGVRAGSGAEVTQQTKEQDGDPRYLSEARKVLEDLRKVVGVDAPTQTELSGKNGEAIKTESAVTIYIPDNGRD